MRAGVGVPADDTERFFEVADEVSRDEQIFADAAAPPFTGSASDESGSLTVTLDSVAGVSVAVGDDWRSHYEPDALAAGILQTLQLVIAERNAAWAENLDRAMDVPRSNVPVPPRSESVTATMQAAFDADADPGATVMTTLQNLLDVLDDVTANFDATFDEIERRALATQRTETFSRAVSVEVNVAGDLQSLTIAAEWADRSTAGQISREINDAIGEARATAAASAIGDLEGTPLAKYERLMHDPDAFARFLRGEE
jgi:hypothetical protein